MVATRNVAIGTFQTYRDVRLESASNGKSGSRISGPSGRLL